jgi:hypothetical protein
MDYPADARRAMAKKGTALPDGSFPIANERDLANALQALGRAKDRAKARAHIVARAKALGLVKSLPDDWKVQEASFAGDLHPRDRLGKFMDKINAGGRPSKGEHRAALDALDHVLPDIAGSHHAIESHKAAPIGTRLDYMAARGQALAAFGTVAFPPKLKVATEKHEDVLQAIRGARSPFDDERLRRRKNRDHALGEARIEERLVESGFDPGSHLRDRSGKFRQMALSLRGHQLQGHALPKPSKLPTVRVTRGQKQAPGWQGAPNEFDAHEVLPGLALHSGDNSHQVFHVATGLPVGPSMYGSRKSVVEQVRGALGHLDWTNPDPRSYAGSSAHKQASEVLDAAAGAHHASRSFGYRGSRQHEVDTEALNFLRERGRKMEGDPAKTPRRPNSEYVGGHPGARIPR